MNQRQDSVQKRLSCDATEL